jgi:hypothetical protein
MVGWAHGSLIFNCGFCPVMRPHTLWTCILDTPWTPAIFLSIFRHISNRYSIISIFPGLFRLLDVRAISHVDRTATATYYQSHRSILHLIPSFLPLAYHITGDWGIFAYITWPLIYYCDTLLKRWLLHSSHDIPIHFAIFIIWFRIFSPFYIYLTLPYPHKKKNRREIRSPHRLGLLRLHCDCVSTATASYTSYCGF